MHRYVIIVGRTHQPSAILIRIRNTLVFCLQSGQPAARFPVVRPRAVIQRVANGVVGNGLAIVRRQLVLPVAVRIAVRNRLQRGSQRARGIRVPHLAGDVPAQVVVVHPRGARASARRIVRVVHARELTKAVVCVGRRNSFARFAQDVAHIVIRIAEVHAILRDRRHQRRGRVYQRRIARHIVVRRPPRQVPVARALRCNAPQFVVGVLHLAGIRAVLDRRGAVVVVVGIVRNIWCCTPVSTFA